MPPTAIEEPGPTTGAELFAPPRWLAPALIVVAAAALAAAGATPWMRLPLVSRVLLALALLITAGVALRALRWCRVRYLVGEREVTRTIGGHAVRTVSFPEVSEFREIPTWWGGRRVRLAHTAGALDIDLTFFGSQARRLFATLRYRMRPQFFRRVDEILTRGGRFPLRPGARVRLAVQMGVAAALAALLLRSPIVWVGLPAAALLVLLELDAACTVVVMDAAGLGLRSLWRRRRVSPGKVLGVRFESRTRLFGPAERVIVLECGAFDVRIPDSVTEFEALAGAIEGFSRQTQTRGLAQL